MEGVLLQHLLGAAGYDLHDPRNKGDDNDRGDSISRHRGEPPAQILSLPQRLSSRTTIGQKNLHCKVCGHSLFSHLLRDILWAPVLHQLPDPEQSDWTVLYLGKPDRITSDGSHLVLVYHHAPFKDFDKALSSVHTPDLYDLPVPCCDELLQTLPLLRLARVPD